MGKTRISPAGILNNRKPTYGFTLIELIVVISVISALVIVTLPNVKWGGLLQNQTQGVGFLIQLMEKLKGRAVQKNLDIFLHVDSSAGISWITDASMDEAAVRDARDTPLDIPGGLYISGVVFPEAHAGRQTGPDMIRFSRHGYSDLAIVHIQGGRSPVSLKIEPFLMTVTPFFERITFDDCR
jgi:prepilin-type N-terminal cleavage/methylation domain-containing protein